MFNQICHGPFFKTNYAFNVAIRN